jgi:outer membrane lipoprotein
VNRAVTFDQIKNAPSSYRGELVVFGGKVLSVTRLEDTTRVEVLQLPLTQDLAPVMEGSQSEGRFVAFDTQQTILEPGIPVTIVGEVKSSTQGHGGDRQYELPTLVIRDMTVWDKDKTVLAPLTYYGSPHGYGYRPYYFSGVYGVHGLD